MRLALLALLALVAACSGEAPVGKPCAEQLAGTLAEFRPVPPREEGACGWINGVELTAVGARLSRPAVADCPLARALIDYEARAVQPAALALLAQPVRTIHHVGTYNCRTIRGSSKLSQHAFAKAIDITAFELADGSRIRVDRDWHDPGPRGEFLRAVGKSACRHFNVVLTPAHDAAHADHFHLDVGRWTACRAS